MCANVHTFYTNQVYKFNCGSSMGNASFIWKVDHNIDQKAFSVSLARQLTEDIFQNAGLPKSSLKIKNDFNG